MSPHLILELQILVHALWSCLNPFVILILLNKNPEYLAVWSQILLLVQQMEAINTQALAARVSPVTLAQQAIIDAYLCLGHLTAGAQAQEAGSSCAGYKITELTGSIQVTFNVLLGLDVCTQ